MHDPDLKYLIKEEQKKDLLLNMRVSGLIWFFFISRLIVI